MDSGFLPSAGPGMTVDGMSPQQQLSYAQRYEDMHLLRVFGEQPAGFYIDVGAGHPVYDNVSFTFHLRGWRGITVEPNPWLAKLSAAVRPHDVRLQTVVGAVSGETTYYLVEDLHGLSTTVESHARKARREFGKASRAMTMPVTTLRALCEQYAPRTSISSRSTWRAPKGPFSRAATGRDSGPRSLFWRLSNR